MVKTKYQRMNREEKKAARNDFFSTDHGKYLKAKLNRLIIYGIILIGFGIYLIIDANIKDANMLQTLYGIGIIVVAFVFIFGRSIIIQRRVNDYLTIDKVKKNKKNN